jgi:IS1 family transposase
VQPSNPKQPTLALGWIATDRETRRILDFQLGTRGVATFKTLWDRLKHTDPVVVATDHYSAYATVLNQEIHLQSKPHTHYIDLNHGKNDFYFSDALHLLANRAITPHIHLPALAACLFLDELLEKAVKGEKKAQSFFEEKLKLFIHRVTSFEQIPS